jgi:hypothetical protein
MSPQEREKARSYDRIKYARRMQRDTQGFRAMRCAIQARYDRKQRRPNVQQTPARKTVKPSARPHCRAALDPEALEKVRSRDRIKYATRMARDPLGFRAKCCAIQKRHYWKHKRPGVHVTLIF